MARIKGTSRVGVRTGRRVTLYLDDATLDKARAIGLGSVSEGVRVCVLNAPTPLPPDEFDANVKAIAHKFAPVTAISS